MKTGAKRECPDRESRPSAQHPHRTHRTHDTTDQWRETILVARPKLGGFSSSPSGSRKSVPSGERVVDVFSFVLVGKYMFFRQATVSQCSSQVIQMRFL